MDLERAWQQLADVALYLLVVQRAEQSYQLSFTKRHHVSNPFKKTHGIFAGFKRTNHSPNADGDGAMLPGC